VVVPCFVRRHGEAWLNSESATGDGEAKPLSRMTDLSIFSRLCQPNGGSMDDVIFERKWEMAEV
jgi:hypothetical protein